MITLCIPTLNRYDLLEKCIESAEAGEVKPDRYLIIDNGTKLTLNHPKLEIVNFGYNIGVAKAWNYFIKNTTEIRIISNDDIYFYPATIKEIVENYKTDFICCSNEIEANSFSLYTISDEIVNSVGLFDEEISPNYAYFEDNDYHRRMQFAGFEVYRIPSCYVGHLKSATLKSYTNAEMAEHHKKFNLAQQNYIKKWGNIPGKETYTAPYNK